MKDKEPLGDSDLLVLSRVLIQTLCDQIDAQKAKNETLQQEIIWRKQEMQSMIDANKEAAVLEHKRQHEQYEHKAPEPDKE